MATPTSRTLFLLRRCGYVAAVVEKWNAFAGVRQDLFGCIDVVAVHPHRQAGVLGVQCTTAANLSARLAKARQRPELRVWLAASNAFEVHAWAKRDSK